MATHEADDLEPQIPQEIAQEQELAAEAQENGRTVRIKIPKVVRRLWKALEPIRTYVLLPLLQGMMLGLGQHGMRYLLSGLIGRRALTHK